MFDTQLLLCLSGLSWLGFQGASGAFPLPFNCEGNHQQPHPGPETYSADGRTAGALILLAELERRELDSDVPGSRHLWGASS